MIAGQTKMKIHSWIAIFFIFIFSNNVYAQALDLPQLVDRGPYIQKLTQTSVSIKWWVFTDDTANNTIHYGTSSGSLTSSNTDTTFKVRNVCGSSVECNDFHEYELTLSGLTANTRYYYAVGTSTTPSSEESANGTFMTFPNSGTVKPTRIWAIGDSGTKSTQALLVLESMQNYTKSRDPDVWIMLGDNAYINGDNREYGDAVFFMYPDFLKNVAAWPTFGDRDGVFADSSTQTGWYFSIFNLPTNAELGGSPSGTEAYYSYDYSNIHFVVLDTAETSLSPGSPMLTWLQSDLNTNTKEWVIAYFHHSPYSKGSNDSDPSTIATNVRANALPILETAGADLVLSSHSHAYERSFLIDGHYGSSGTFNPGTNQLNGGNGKSNPLPTANGPYNKPLAGGQPTANSGTVYAVVGSSGILQTNETPLDRSFEETAGPLNHPAMQFSLNTLGSMIIDVYDNRLEAIFLDGFGDIADQFTITHGNNNVAPEIFNVSANHPLTLEVQFSEPLEKTSAENETNYSLDNGVTVTAATLLEDYRTVRLLTSTLSNSTTYNLTVTNVEDYETNTSISAPGIQYSFTPEFIDPPVYSAHFQDGYYPGKSYDGTRDTYIFEGLPDTNYGDKKNLIAHGQFEDAIEGEAIIMVSWDISSIPSNATVQSATFYWDPFNRSETPYFLRQLLTPWDEISVTWNSYGGDTNIGTDILGTMPPEKFGVNPVPLNPDGINIIQGWVDGTTPNYGLALRNAGPGFIPPSGEWWNAVRGRQRQTNNRPRLSITYTVPTGGDSISPSIIAPPDVTVDSTGDQTSVSLGTAVAVDDNGTPSTSNDAPAGGFPLGTTIVTWTATDAAGNTGTDTQKVTVKVPESIQSNTISFQNQVEPSAFYLGTQDAFIRQTSPNQNKGSNAELWSDGLSGDPENTLSGELESVIKWDVSAIPQNAVINSVTVSFNVFNDSPVDNNLYEVKIPWTEDTVTWNVAAEPSAYGTTILGAIPPFTLNENIVNLNQTGINLVQAWVNGSKINNGLLIKIAGSTNGMGVHSSEAANAANRPKLTVSYTISTGGDTTPPVVTAPPDITTTDTTPDLGTGTAIDNVDGPLVPTNDAPAVFPLGVTIVTWSATDSSGNTGTDTQTVTIEEATGGSVTVSFQNGVEPDASYSGTQDSYLRETSPNQNEGNNTQLLSDGVASDPGNGLFGEVMTVVAWDLSSIPSNATVQSASIMMDFFDASSGAYHFYEALTPWTEGTVTWNSFGGGTSNVGSDIIATIPPFSFDETEVNLTAQGLSLLQGWIDGSIPNNGLAFKTAGSNNGLGANSSEAATNRPKITITYTVSGGGSGDMSFQNGVLPTPAYSGTNDSFLRQTSPNQNEGNNIQLLSDGVASDPGNGLFGELISVISWDISSIPSNATVQSASITMDFFDASSGDYHFYEALTPWTEGTVTWNSFGGGSANVGTDIIATVPGFSFDETEVNLTAQGLSLVQGWVDGSIPNNGLVLKTGGSNNGLGANSSEAATNRPKLRVIYSTSGGSGGDTIPPVVTAPADITTTDTTPNLGTGTAVDNVDGPLTPTNNAPGVFPLGTTIVTWSATDSSGNTGTDNQSVTITDPTSTDTTPPVVTAPADITTEATGPTTSVSLGTGTAVDNVDGPITPTNNAPSGGFPVGTTTVTWSATDTAGNTGTDTQSVTITDTTAPTVTAPADITTTDTTPNLGTGTASDLVDGSITPTNNAPGTFPIGTTIVTWSATDTAGNTGTDTQSVTVQSGGSTTVNLTSSKDTFIREFQPFDVNGLMTTLEADADQLSPPQTFNDEIFAVLAWNVSSIPSTATVQSVTISFNVTNTSSGTYNLFQTLTSWSENTANWFTFSPLSTNIGTGILGSFTPTAGTNVITLNAAGINLVQGWINGSITNNGIAVRSGGTTDNTIFNSKEASSNKPQISITYN